MTEINIKEYLISKKELQAVLNKKKKNYQEKSIKKLLIPEYETKGWKISAEFKTTARIRKDKNHDRILEDRFWCILANMGFASMNGLNNLELKYNDNLNIQGRQIDVFAIDEETIIIAECKSAEIPQKNQCKQ